jgi:hypothetical protein
MHAQPDFVVVSRSGFGRRLTLLGGKTAVREFKAGKVLWTDAQSHIGDTDTQVLIIQLNETQVRSCLPLDPIRNSHQATVNCSPKHLSYYFFSLGLFFWGRCRRYSPPGSE